MPVADLTNTSPGQKPILFATTLGLESLRAGLGYCSSQYRDLTGVTLTIRGKQHMTRTVEISPRLAGKINEQRKHSDSEYLFPNRKGKPNQHLLRDLQDLAKRAGAKFHAELHKLSKTGASRRYLKGVPLPRLMQELGHESLATTQDYLADVPREDEAKKAVADANSIPGCTGHRERRRYRLRPLRQPILRFKSQLHRLFMLLRHSGKRAS